MLKNHQYWTRFINQLLHEWYINIMGYFAAFMSILGVEYKLRDTLDNFQNWKKITWSYSIKLHVNVLNVSVPWSGPGKEVTEIFHWDLSQGWFCVNCALLCCCQFIFYPIDTVLGFLKWTSIITAREKKHFILGRGWEYSFPFKLGCLLHRSHQRLFNTKIQLAELSGDVTAGRL